MSKCGFCYRCNLKYCPKKGKSKTMSLQQVSFSVPLYRKLEDFCKERGYMRGEEYYRVPDYNYAVSFLLDRFLKSEKGRRGKKHVKSAR